MMVGSKDTCSIMAREVVAFAATQATINQQPLPPHPLQNVADP